jgi:hypothetical protein
MRIIKNFAFIFCFVVASFADGGNNPKCNYFWLAVGKADKIAVIKAVKRGKDLKINEFLSGEKWQGKIAFPNWIVWQTRVDGRYLLPVSKLKNDYVIAGQKYSIPVLPKGKGLSLNKIILEYKKLKSESEKDFLVKLVSDNKYPELDFVSIRRLSGLGEFKKVMPKKDCNFWVHVFCRKNTDVKTKRYLLYELSRKNFLNCIAVYESALKDPRLSRMAGSIFVRKDKKVFEKLMLAWLDNDKFRDYALANSQNMLKNRGFVSKAIKYFDPNDKKNLRNFIPLLCVSPTAKAQKFIKDFLCNSKSSKDFMLQYTLLNNLNQAKSKDYTKELKVFLRNHQKNPFIIKGAAYPAILASLCRAEDMEGYKLTLAYMDKLKPESKQAMDKAKLHGFMRAFHNYNPHLNTFKKVKADIQSQLANTQKVKKKK